jgi:hypothetical protein
MTIQSDSKSTQRSSIFGPHALVIKHALSGSCAGIVGTVIGHPLDVVKVKYILPKSCKVIPSIF